MSRTAKSARGTGGQYAQHVIARCVTVRIVDALEVVHVDKRQHDRIRTGCLAAEQSFYFPVERRPVQRSGEGVVRGADALAIVRASKRMDDDDREGVGAEPYDTPGDRNARVEAEFVHMHREDVEEACDHREGAARAQAEPPCSQGDQRDEEWAHPDIWKGAIRGDKDKAGDREYRRGSPG